MGARDDGDPQPAAVRDAEGGVLITGPEASLHLLAVTGTGFNIDPVQAREFFFFLASVLVSGLAAVMASPQAFSASRSARSCGATAVGIVLAWHLSMLATSAWIVRNCTSPRGCGRWQWPLLTFGMAMVMVIAPAVVEAVSDALAQPPRPGAILRRVALVVLAWAAAFLLLLAGWRLVTDLGLIVLGGFYAPLVLALAAAACRVVFSAPAWLTSLVLVLLVALMIVHAVAVF